MSATRLSTLRRTPRPFALSLSKGMRAPAHGFDKACPEPVEGLSQNGMRRHE